MHSLTLKSLDLFHIACIFLEPRRSKHNPNYKKYLFHFYFGIFEQFLIFEKQNFQNYKLDLKNYIHFQMNLYKQLSSFENNYEARRYIFLVYSKYQNLQVLQDFVLFQES